MSETPVTTAIEAGSAKGWMQTQSGKRFYPLDPRAIDIDIVDIAHSLAHQCRYAGHTRFHYSVATHSVLLANYAFRPDKYSSSLLRMYALRMDALTMLLHDSAEAYLSDMPRPIKYRMPEYLACEQRLESVILPHFGLSFPLPTWAKELDSRIIVDERPQVMRRNDNPWSVDALAPLGVKIPRWSPRRAKYEFLRRFYMWHDGLGRLRAAWKAAWLTW